MLFQGKLVAVNSSILSFRGDVGRRELVREHGIRSHYFAVVGTRALLDLAAYYKRCAFTAAGGYGI